MKNRVQYKKYIFKNTLLFHSYYGYLKKQKSISIYINIKVGNIDIININIAINIKPKILSFLSTGLRWQFLAAVQSITQKFSTTQYFKLQ